MPSLLTIPHKSLTDLLQIVLNILWGLQTLHPLSVWIWHSTWEMVACCILRLGLSQMQKELSFKLVGWCLWGDPDTSPVQFCVPCLVHQESGQNFSPFSQMVWVATERSCPRWLLSVTCSGGGIYYITSFVVLHLVEFSLDLHWWPYMQIFRLNWEPAHITQPGIQEELLHLWFEQIPAANASAAHIQHWHSSSAPIHRATYHNITFRHAKWETLSLNWSVNVSVSLLSFSFTYTMKWAESIFQSNL